MRLLAILSILLLSACGVSNRLDESTGTTKAQRCAGYKAAEATALASIAAIEEFRATHPSTDAETRLALAKVALATAQAGIAAVCVETQ